MAEPVRRGLQCFGINPWLCFRFRGENHLGCEGHVGYVQCWGLRNLCPLVYKCVQ